MGRGARGHLAKHQGFSSGLMFRRMLVGVHCLLTVGAVAYLNLLLLMRII